jgi:hypothetical protein
MKEKDGRIFVTSVSNASKKLEYYGDAKLEGITLLKLLYKYASYSTTYKQLQRIDSMVSTLQTTDDLICMEYQALPAYNIPLTGTGVVVIGAENPNQAPTLGDISITLLEGITAFGFADVVLYENYSDDAGGSPSNFVIKTLPANGGLYYNGSIVTLNTLLPISAFLVFERYPDAISGVDDAYVTTFTFSAFDDDTQLPLESNIATVTVNVDALGVTNEPATVGDRAQYSVNRATTVFTVEDFTANAIAPYFDPEGNDLDAIRIDEISDANTGVYYFFENPVVAGQVITNAQLAAGSFYHVAADQNEISTDTFEASVRDTGSMIWVS